MDSILVDYNVKYIYIYIFVEIDNCEEKYDIVLDKVIIISFKNEIVYLLVKTNRMSKNS